MEENNQTINQVKSILTPPNWKNEGKNETLNKEYKSLLNKYFGSYIDDLNNSEYTDAAILKFATKDEGYQAAYNIFKTGKYEDAISDKNNIGLNLIKNNDNVILEIHGNEEGKVVYGNYTYKTNELIQRLEDTGLIPKGTKQIYTMSCYGGLQEKGLTSSGIPFESSHTSLEPTIGYANRDIVDSIDNTLKEQYQNDVDDSKSEIEDYTKSLEEEKEELNKIKNEHPDWTDIIQDKEKTIKEYQEEINYYKKQLADSEKKLQEHINEIAKSDNKKSTLVNLTTSGNTTDKYKQDVLDSFKKYGDDFAKAEFIAEPKEIENALWYLISPKERKNKLENIEFHEKLIKDYKGYVQSAKNTLPFYKGQLQKAKEANDIEQIEEYTEKVKDIKKRIKSYKKTIKEYSTIAYKDKLQLQELDKKDKIYGKDYEAKSNFVSNQEKYLTSKEAFKKYDLDSDEFYISQGLDPEEQRKTINELNSKRKPSKSNEEILNELHSKSEEAANQFYETTEEANQIIKEYNQLKIEENKPKPEKSKPKLEKPKPEKSKPKLEKPKPEKSKPKLEKPKPEKSKPKLEKPKPEPEKPKLEEIDFGNILEDTAKETAKQNNNLTKRTIENTAKKALNTKTLGIAAIGATIAAAGIAGISAHNKNKRKHEEENRYTYSNNNYYINHDQDLKYANNIIGFSTGHSTYNLGY